MKLVWREIGERVASAEETVQVVAGKTLTIETSPDGEEILSVLVPAGKVMSFFLRVTVREAVA